MSAVPARAHASPDPTRPRARRDDTLSVVEQVILSRRSCLQIDPERPVDPALIEHLLAVATWAPNHHRTEPWRFAIFSGDGRIQLGDTLADGLAAAGALAGKVEKTRTKYLRAPHIVAIGAVGAGNPTETLENQYAVAAATQNFLLAATAAGLATFWGSPAIPDSSELRGLCAFPASTHITGLIYLGHPNGICSSPARSSPIVTWITAEQS